MPVLSSVHIYPIKATRGIDLAEAAVALRGLAHDRRWMLVDEAGVFLSQREHARLALVCVRVEPGQMTVEAPSMPPLRVPVPGPEAPRLPVRIWSNEVAAAEADAGAHAWFSQYLDFACRLVYMDAAAERPIDPAYAPEGGTVSFADGYPVLLTAEASLADLNARLDAPVPMTRFRPNVVVTGTEAFAEDTWREVRIGAVRFYVAKPCARCVVTTVDQQTAEQGKEPLRTLSSYRRWDGKTYFGQNLIPTAPGVIRVGDPVEVLAVR